MKKPSKSITYLVVHGTNGNITVDSLKIAGEIQKFVDYAKSSGSNNAGRYYSILTRTVYSIFLIVEPKADKVRELLTAIQLLTLQTAELIATDVLAQCMKNNLNYKDI
jgi:hypothetical protein